MRLALAVIVCLMIAVTSALAEPAIQWLVFTSFRDENAEIYRVDSQGEHLENLTGNPADDRHPVWSPDGTTIVFVSNRDGKPGLYRMDADGNHIERLVLSDDAIIEPLFSPDGSRINYITYEESPYEATSLMLVSADGQNPVELMKDILFLEWMPDGQTMLGRIVANTLPVWIDVKTGEQTPIEGITMGSFAISPDGTQIAYDYGGEFSQIELMDTASGIITVLPGLYPGSEISDSEARWSPDGNRLAYLTRRSYLVYDITITEPDPAAAPYLLLEQYDFRSVEPVWSPDSALIAFLAAPGKEELDIEKEAFDIYVVDVSGENLVNVSNHPARDVEPAWQPVRAGENG
jgi:Tol biopolymer transport system component